MKFKSSRIVLLSYLTIASIFLINININTGYIVGEESQDRTNNGNYIKEEINPIKDDLNLETSELSLFEDTLESFNPNVSITGDYNSENIAGNIVDEDTTITLPGRGEYSLQGNITNLEAQYIQNPGAELDLQFYSETATNVGLGLERIESSVEKSSYSGDYLWRYYSQNTETTTYALYQEDIPLYYTDTIISYNYALNSSSTLENTVNSSLIFDFVFDTCRIMVTHWHYTNVEPPSIGANTTSPFIVFRLLQNSTWDNDWKDYTLLISSLFDEGDPFIPTMLKSFGIYVISPETSHCEILIDDFHIRTSVDPTDINLTLNEIQVSSSGPGNGIVDTNFECQEASQNEYNITWNHESCKSITGSYSIELYGIIEVMFNKQIIFYNQTTLLFSLDIYNLSTIVNRINITYPDSWTIYTNPQGADIISNENLGDGYKLLSLDTSTTTESIQLDFMLMNYITNIDIESTTFFETLNAELTFRDTTGTSSVFIFWESEKIEGETCSLFSNNLSYTFPPWIPDGSLDIILLVFNGNNIGYQNETVSILRKPAVMNVENNINIPKYAVKELKVNYDSLDPYTELENATIKANLDGEIIHAVKEKTDYFIFISSFYLTQNEYMLSILAESPTHATIFKVINITIQSSEIMADFQYNPTDNPREYSLDFNITSGGLPVGYAPITIEISETINQTGITNLNGEYGVNVELSLDVLTINVSCKIFKVTEIIFSKTFEIQFENSLANVGRSSDDVVISTNITLTYDINYPIDHDRWTYIISDEMLPILESYIETDELRIPVTWDSHFIYWQIHANDTTTNHKLIIVTQGPTLEITNEEIDEGIKIHFVIRSETKEFSDLSIIYHFNDSYRASKYDWNLIVNNQKDVTKIYGLEVNNLYAFFTDLDILQGSILVFDLIGSKIIQTISLTNILIPVLSAGGVLLGTITVGIKIYNKRKGMILEI